MKLIDILVQKLGGWPIDKKHHAFIAQDDDGDLWSFPAKPSLNGKRGDWEVHSGDGCYLFNLPTADDNRQSIITREQYEAALAASKAEWDGEGLPPMGCECEVRYRHGGADWGNFKCVAVDSDVAFGWCADEPVTLLEDNYEFRPIRSEADKKRDETINKIQSHAHVNFTPPISAGQAIALYDAIAAGKIPHIRID